MMRRTIYRLSSRRTGPVYYRGMDRERLEETEPAMEDYRNAVLYGRADAEVKLKALETGVSPHEMH